jgi:gas vesicle structural protein
VLDRLLNKGVVVTGEVVISVAGIDLVYLGLNVVLTSIQTARECAAESSGRIAS